ncbi:MAG: symmetrical bis(5'-nucleosyl)-tetraphosphatase [Gammaproteobacteria bacterium]|nr:symmetrical bis(5'-nucleosyl)-tetraphosphatase [Gammaproteobacteria bacterium]
MAIYAIGDVQGCFASLQQLLEKIRFDPTADQLWFTGDLVNRGPQSLEVLRLVKSFGDSAITVLGNHDLHLLAVSEGFSTLKPLDTLDDILRAADRDELLYWLRHRPLLHHSVEHNKTLVHAGLPPIWDLTTAQQCASEVEQALRGEQYHDFLRHMYGNEPSLWQTDLTGLERLRYITNALTRMRYCDADGRLELKSKMAPGKQPAGLIPWYEVTQRRNQNLNIVFGHWSTHGEHFIPGIYALDTGCLWGGSLTALRVDGETYRTQVNCAAQQHP